MNSIDINKNDNNKSVGEIFKEFYIDEKRRAISNQIFALFIKRLENPEMGEIEPGQKTSAMDLSYSPKEVPPTHGIIASVLGFNPNLIYNTSISREGFAAINDIFDKAKAHLEKHDGLGIGKDLQKWMNTKFMCFAIQSDEELFSFIEYLSRIRDDKGNLKQSAHILRHCIILKTIYITALLEKNRAIQKKPKIFKRISKKIFGEFFNNDGIEPKVYETKDGKEFDMTLCHQGEIEINGQKIEYELKGRGKSNDSIHDKMERDKLYGTPESLNDIFGFEIQFNTIEELAAAIHAFGNYITESKFFSTAKEIKIANKNMFHENDLGIIESFENGKIKELLKSVCIGKNSNNNGKSSDSYQDIKLIIPLDIEGVILSIEVKFVLTGNQNEAGMSNHHVFDIKRQLAKGFRRRKYLSENHVIREVKKKLTKEPNLIAHIGADNYEQAVTLIVEHMLECGHLKKVILKEHENGDNPKNEFYIVTNIRKDLRDNEFYPEIIIL